MRTIDMRSMRNTIQSLKKRAVTSSWPQAGDVRSALGLSQQSSPLEASLLCVPKTTCWPRGHPTRDAVPPVCFPRGLEAPGGGTRDSGREPCNMSGIQWCLIKTWPLTDE